MNRSLDELIAIASQLNRTDIGLAQRLALYEQDTVRYCPTMHQWFVWDGMRWFRANEDHMMNVARRVVMLIFNECLAYKSEDDSKAFENHARFAAASSSHGHLTAMIKVAQGDPTLWKDNDEFDANPYVLNCLNGTVDLRTGTVQDHDPGDYITHLVRHNYVPSTTAPRFTALFDRVFRDLFWMMDDAGGYILDEETRRLVWKSLGYSILGANVEEKIFFSVGAAGSGKSKLIEHIAFVLGPDLAHRTKTDLLTHRIGGGHHDSEKWSLVGKRFVYTSETSQRMRIDEAAWKDITDAQMTVRKLRAANELNVRNMTTIWVTSNEDPVIGEWDGGVERRLVTFDAGPEIPPGERDPYLGSYLAEHEAEGTVSFIVGACMAWFADFAASGKHTGLAPTPRVLLRLMTQADEADYLGRYVEERIVLGEGLRVPRAYVHDDCKHWRGAGEHINRNKLYARLKKLPGVSEVDRNFVGMDTVDRVVAPRNEG